MGGSCSKQAAVDALATRPTQAEPERLPMQAQAEAERKRQAEVEAERKRQAEVEAELKRQAEAEAEQEKWRQCLDEHAAYAAKNVDLFQAFDTPNVKLGDLDDVLQDLHIGMPETLSKEPVRFVLARRLLEWNRLLCYEELDNMPSDVYEIPYDATKDELWTKTCVLSWRWSSSEKPSSLEAGFSPMSKAQLLQFQVSLTRAISECQILYVWLDWCCVPQYSKSPMVEIARSKVFYMRAGLMIVVPEIKPIPEGVIYVLLQRVVRQMSKREIEEKSAAHMALRALRFLVDHRQVAGREYFGRVWTLCERLARYGRNEALYKWLSLADWMGMVVDALLHSSEDNAAADIYWSKLFPEEVRGRLKCLMAKLKLAVQTNSIAAVPNIDLELGALFEDVVQAWQTAKMYEAPNTAWLQQYLTQEAGTIYQACKPHDTVWAVYSYFIWTQRDVSSNAEWGAAINDLFTISGVECKSGWLWQSFQQQQREEMDKKADDLCNQKKYAEAELLYRRALAIREEALGPKHADTATSLNVLAGCLGNQNKYAEAEPLYRRAVGISEEALGPKLADTATLLNSMANCLCYQYKYAEAERLYRRALAFREEALGSNHADTAMSLNNLAVCLSYQDKYAEAERLYRRALAFREEVLGSNHADTAMSLNNLASCLCYQKRYAEAEPLYRRALAFHEEALGSNHADTAMFAPLNSLANCLFGQREYAEAEPLYRRALAIREEALGPKHADTARSLHDLAVCLDYLGKDDEAALLRGRVDKQE